VSERTKGVFRDFVREGGGDIEEAERVVEAAAPAGPRPTGEFRAWLLESGGLTREERLLIETDDRKAIEVLTEDWDVTNADLLEEWRLFEKAGA
jgi:hypothetical protein